MADYRKVRCVAEVAANLGQIYIFAMKFDEPTHSDMSFSEVDFQ